MSKYHGIKTQNIPGWKSKISQIDTDTARLKRQ